MNSWRKTNVLTKLGIAIYAMSALAFVSELYGEITGIYFHTLGWEGREIAMMLTLAGFLIGGVLIWRAHRLVMARNVEVEHSLRAARGEFQAMVETQFAQWGLTGAERDIARLTIKGLSVAEIAELRETSQGTIKSQNTSIYRKAGVGTRTQLLGALIDELLVEPEANDPRNDDDATPVAGLSTRNT